MTARVLCQWQNVPCCPTFSGYDNPANESFRGSHRCRACHWVSFGAAYAVDAPQYLIKHGHSLHQFVGLSVAQNIPNIPNIFQKPASAAAGSGTSPILPQLNQPQTLASLRGGTLGTTLRENIHNLGRSSETLVNPEELSHLHT